MTANESTTVATSQDDRQTVPAELWEFSDVMAYLKVKTEKTIRRRIREDGLPFRRIGGLIRFVPDEVRNWAQQQAAA